MLALRCEGPAEMSTAVITRLQAQRFEAESVQGSSSDADYGAFINREGYTHISLHALALRWKMDAWHQEASQQTGASHVKVAHATPS